MMKLLRAVSTAVIMAMFFVSPLVMSAPSCERNPKFCNPPPDDGGSGTKGEYVFHVDIEGVFLGNQDSRPQSISEGTKNVIFSPRLSYPMAFGLGPFFNRLYAGGSDGAECFGHLISTDTFISINGSLHLNRAEGSQIGVVAFWFTGRDDDPNTDTEINYVLEFHDPLGLGWDPENDFPPSSTSPIVLTPTHWEMRTEGKGELKKGPCLGMGELNFGNNEFVEFSLYRKD